MQRATSAARATSMDQEDGVYRSACAGCGGCGRPRRSPREQPASGRVILVGNPNVGKSAVFNALTGGRATVSNYPGTTVEMLAGFLRGTLRRVRVIDTPGMYSLVTLTDEELIAAREALAASGRDVIVQVGDAKNLERTLALTLQLLGLDTLLVLAVNMADEAEAAGIEIDAQTLSSALGIPVVITSAVSGRGIDSLRSAIEDSLRGTGARRTGRERYMPLLDCDAGQPSPGMESAAQTARILEALGECFEAAAPGRGRLYGCLFLEGGRAVLEGVVGEETLATASGIARQMGEEQAAGASLLVASRRHARAAEIARRALAPARRRAARGRYAQAIDRLLIHPVFGFVPLAAVVYFGLYTLVGKVGAGVLVDFLDVGVFERFVAPWAQAAAAPLPALARDLLAGEYGLVTVALRYALAIIMPIVGSFFLAFALLEDSGYLPRMALMLDSWFRRVGLNGRAVIPIVLGFGCDTMATVVTRTLETKRERVIATLLLALAIPCSAQLGLIMGILSQKPAALAAWAVVILAVFLAVGTAAARLLPGDPPGFFMELPPLRLPRLANILTKSWARMTWYVKEVIPVFAGMSVALTLGARYGALDRIVAALRFPMSLMGLPAEAAGVFIYGFFRRDYGAAGLYDLARAGRLTANQTLVAAVVLTLFVPCVAQFAVMVRERGVRTAVAIFAFVMLSAGAVGVAMNAAINALGVVL